MQKARGITDNVSLLRNELFIPSLLLKKLVHEARKLMKKTCTHQPDCLKLIQRIIDREATPEEEAAFLANKEQCLPCQEGYELEQSLRKAIKSNCSSKCPETLFARIKAKLFVVLILISILIPLFC